MPGQLAGSAACTSMKLRDVLLDGVTVGVNVGVTVTGGVTEIVGETEDVTEIVGVTDIVGTSYSQTNPVGEPVFGWSFSPIAPPFE